MLHNAQKVRHLRDRIIDELSSMDGVLVTGPDPGPMRLPGLASFIIDGVDSETLVMDLSAKGVCVSAGSACSSGTGKPSYVLRAMESAMMHEINQQCLEADARFSLDLDTMVLWTLYQCYGWREKRLHDFYLAMAREHRRMREYYQMDDLYPERYKLKEKGIDIEKWQEEVLRDDP